MKKTLYTTLLVTNNTNIENKTNTEAINTLKILTCTITVNQKTY